MTGLVRKATLLGVCAVLAASTALATVPDLANSRFDGLPFGDGLCCNLDPNPTCPTQPKCTNYIWVMAQGQETAKKTHDICLRDFANNPLSGATICINFSNACDINLCNYTPVPNPWNYRVNCDSSTVCVNTDASGCASFNVRGGGKFQFGANVGKQNSVIITVGGVKFTSATAVSNDQNDRGLVVPPAINTTNAGDLGATAGAIAHPLGYVARADTNKDGKNNAPDIGTIAVKLGSGLGCAVNTCKRPTCPF